MLEAFGHLARRFPRLHVAIAGRGELDAPLRARAEALGVSDRFHLLGLRRDIANLLAGADAFVLPSLSEGLPLALIEAMLAERPIVATRVGEVGSVLNGGGERAGLLVPPGDAGALADALSHLLSDAPDAGRLAAAAGRRGQDYTLAKMLERYVAVYASLLRSD